MKKFGIASIVLLVLVSFGYSVFDQLGGNNPIQIELVEGPPVSLAGKTYRGTPQDKGLNETFQSIESLLALHPGKNIHTIYFVEPAGKLDTMEVFVGLDLSFSPPELESKTFSEQRFILATITGSKWVMPGPEKVKTKIAEFAEGKNLQLSGIFIDKIVGEEEVQVIAPVR